ncbi:MAG: hypothetical protein AAGI01_18520 [Myxococcota bacterium]
MNTPSEPPRIHPAAAPLQALWRELPGLRGALVCSTQGDIHAVAGDAEDTMRALTTFAVGMYELGARTALESGVGEAQTLLLGCSAGVLAVVELAGARLLLALAGEEVPVGGLLYDMRRTARTLRA